LAIRYQEADDTLPVWRFTNFALNRSCSKACTNERSRGRGGGDLAQDDASSHVSGVSEEGDVCPEKGEEEAVVVLTHTLVKPHTMVVEDRHTNTAQCTVLGSRDLRRRG
jgi:hypothetical protein